MVDTHQFDTHMTDFPVPCLPPMRIPVTLGFDAARTIASFNSLWSTIMLNGKFLDIWATSSSPTVLMSVGS